MTSHDILDPSTRHRLTVEEYLMLDREGAFGDRRTELFDGEVYYMSPKHRPHARVLGDVYFAVREALRASGSGLIALIDISVRLSDYDVPDPDIAITDAPDGDGILPLGALKLVIEVSDTTLAKDLGFKEELYARAGVPEYWVIDINESRVLCHANPRSAAEGGGYDGQLDVPFGEMLYSATIDGLTVETAGWG
jgi:Uma2 family endonuclease